MKARDERVERIKDTIALSSIIGERVRLRREGRWFRGCCPFHDDSTPSFWVNDDTGRYGCFGCDAAGDIIDYVADIEAVSFSDALDYLEGGYVPSRALSAVRAHSNEDEQRKKVEAARRIWVGAKPIMGTPAEAYLAARCLPLRNLPDAIDLRFARLSFAGSADLHPALIAAVKTVDGEFSGIQRTYLTADGRKLDHRNAKRSLGNIKGNSIRICDSHMDNSHLYVCEGLEDGLSLARMYDDGPVLVAAGAGMMRSLNLPKECRSVTIGADNDRAGLNAAEEVAAAFRTRGIAAHILKPDWRHKDWNDFVRYWDVRRDAMEINPGYQWARG